jgi:TnpA family transposase
MPRKLACSPKITLVFPESRRRMTSDSRRLAILTAREIHELYGLPSFTDEERCLYFDLSPSEHDAVDAVHTAAAAVHMVLQLGYFKAKRQFFYYEPEAIRDDIQHIMKRHFPGMDNVSVKALSKPTRLEQQQTILSLLGYRRCDGAAKTKLELKARRIAMLSTQPITILRETLQYLENKRIMAPGYRFLQDLVSRVGAGERRRITVILGQSMTPEIEQQLAGLLEAGDGMYRISELKHEPKDFSYKALRQETTRRKVFQPLYEFARIFLESAALSNESVKYYASLVQFYTVYKLQRMEAGIVRLYLLCFAHHRFRQINDNLIEAFIHLLDQYEKDAKLSAETAAQQALLAASKNLNAAGKVLNLFVDASIPDDAPFSVVKKKAFSLLDPERFPLVANYMRSISFDKTAFEWSHYGKLSHAFKRNLRHIFAGLDFSGRVEDAPLLEAVTFLQSLLCQGKAPRQTNPSAFPVSVIPTGLRRYLFTAEGKRKGKALEIDRYEFLIYRLLRNALEAGDVYVQDSSGFRRFEDNLIGDERWKNKEAILNEIGAPLLLAPIEETVAGLREEIEARFIAVNKRIEDGSNQHIKITGVGAKRRWTLVYPTDEEPLESPFYSQLPGIDIEELLWFVAGKTGFLRDFTHVLDRYVKDEPDPREILACIVAMGTNMGLQKMAEVSGFSHAALKTAARNYLRTETLHRTNDTICNAISALSVFQEYDIDDRRHSSSDGQRIETQIPTINARNSRKYFGLKKGVSAYTLVLNHVPINAKIIGTHEHESHYVYDLLHNNTTDIKPERHSTDTHGTNQVNFWILRTFGYQFAPRYRDLHKKIDGLIGFQHPKHYADCLIKPGRKAYDGLIFKEWPNIQRIMASIAQKDVTQASMVRMLASYGRQNQTKKALWELENLCRTLYILTFIDDVGLRQSVQKALNRGEAYHRFRRAIAYVHAGKFRVKTEAEQQIWNECSRLIANAIIYYNTLLLSRVYEQKMASGDHAAANIVKNTSPNAWAHVHLTGAFDFEPAESGIDIDVLVARYEDPAFWNRALVEAPDESLA